MKHFTAMKLQTCFLYYQREFSQKKESEFKKPDPKIT